MTRLVHIGDSIDRLQAHDRQLLAHPRDLAMARGSAPLEDLDAVVVDCTDGLSLDLHVLRSMLAEGTTLVVCDRKHLPAGVLVPLAGTWNHTEVLHQQIEMSEPRKKRAWQQLVQAKIRAQAANVISGPDRAKLKMLAAAVRSGDRGNAEAVAAKLYWAATFDGGFRRTMRTNEAENGALNYGYAVARALLARSVVGVGLNPALGFFHRSRQNPFCLVDDLIEPIRPAVDAIVLRNRAAIQESVDIRSALVAVMSRPFRCAEKRGPLNHVADHYALSVKRYVSGDIENIDIPVVDDDPNSWTDE